MRSKVLAMAFLVLGCAAPAFAQAASKAATEKALIANENKVSEAVAKHDLKTFNDLVAADGVSADMAGFMTVAEFTKTFDQVKISAWHIMDTKVMWIDDKSVAASHLIRRHG